MMVLIKEIAASFGRALCDVGIHKGPVVNVGYPLIYSEDECDWMELKELYNLRECARCGCIFTNASDKIHGGIA